MPGSSVHLVINADDFGRSSEVNAAVIRAHEEGVLTSASLMVSAEAAAQAVALAKAHPTLAVGLHLVLARGRPALPPAEIPHLVDRDGRFRASVLSAGLRYSFSGGARSELRRELRAQFDLFRATGLELSHVDSHHHMHLHPRVLGALLPLAREYGAHAVRVAVADELLFSLRHDRHRPLLKLGWKLAFSTLALWARPALRRHPIPYARRVYGVMQTGSVTAPYLNRLVTRLAERQAAAATRRMRDAGKARRRRRSATGPACDLVEVYCHPSLRVESGSLGPNPGDLTALLDPSVRETLSEQGVILTSYPALAASGACLSGDSVLGTDGRVT